MISRSPIFLEIAGTPAAGKTTLASRLHNFFRACGILSEIAAEPAGKYPGDPSDKLKPVFNQWTLTESISLIESYRSKREFEVVIFDRGAIDSLYWLNWFKDAMGYENSTFASDVARSLFYVGLINKVIFLTCTYEVAQRRRPERGRIMNAGVYPQLLANYNKRRVANEIGLSLSSSYWLDTSDLQIDTVESRVRALLDTPRDGNRSDLLAALLR